MTNTSTPITKNLHFTGLESQRILLEIKKSIDFEIVLQKVENKALSLYVAIVTDTFSQGVMEKDTSHAPTSGQSSWSTVMKWPVLMPARLINCWILARLPGRKPRSRVRIHANSARWRDGTQHVNGLGLLWFYF